MDKYSSFIYSLVIIIIVILCVILLTYTVIPQNQNTDTKTTDTKPTEPPPAIKTSYVTFDTKEEMDAYLAKHNLVPTPVGPNKTINIDTAVSETTNKNTNPPSTAGSETTTTKSNEIPTTKTSTDQNMVTPKGMATEKRKTSNTVSKTNDPPKV